MKFVPLYFFDFADGELMVATSSGRNCQTLRRQRGKRSPDRLVAMPENIPACVQAGFCHEVRLSFDSATSLR